MTRRGFAIIAAALLSATAIHTAASARANSDGSSHTGMIENYIVNGPACVVVPDYAASIMVSGATAS